MPDDLGTPVSPPPDKAESGGGPPPGRNPDEVALDLMKFIAVTTGYGRSSGSGAGFSAKTATRSSEEYAESLIQLFERCREVMKRGK